MITRQNVSCLESQFAQETRWMTIGDLYNAYKVLSFLSIYYKRYELWAKYANELNLGWSIQNWVITPLSFHLLVFEMHPTVSPENRIDRKRRNHIQATLKEVNKSKFCAAVLMLRFWSELFPYSMYTVPNLHFLLPWYGKMKQQWNNRYICCIGSFKSRTPL